MKTVAPGFASNETLTFNIEFNSTSTDITTNAEIPIPRMYLETYCCYDNYLMITESGSAKLES
jgi:hypothetical protein